LGLFGWGIMEADQKKKRIWAVLIGPVAFALGMASMIFIVEQSFRLLARQPCWPLAIGDLYLIVYFLIAIIGIGVGSGIARLRIAKNHSKKAFLFMALVVLFVMGLMVWKNYGKPWQEGYWLLRLMLVIGLFGMSLISGFRLFQNINIIIGIGLLFIWIGWATLAPESLLSWMDLSSSLRNFVIVHSLILAIIAGWAYQNLKNISPRILASASLCIFAGFLATAFIGPDKAVEPASNAKNTANSAENENSRPPNLFLIVLDTVRKDHLSLYGYQRDTSPFLKELAKESLVFTNFKSSAPWTLPAHASLFTGLYPHEHHANFGQESGRFSPLEVSFTTLAEILKKRGYATGGISANFAYVNQHCGLGQGFDYFSSDSSSFYILFLKMDLMRIIFNTGLAARVLGNISRKGPADFYYEYYRPYINGEEVNRRARKWTRENCQEGPCFLFLNYMEAHPPYMTPKKYRKSFGGNFGKISYWGIPSYNWYMSAEDTKGVWDFKSGIPAADSRMLNSLYDEEIRYLDDCVRDLLEAIRKDHLYENSLIVILSDHGEAFGEKGLLSHGGSVYEFEMAVPLIIITPFAKTTGINNEISNMIELYPYILNCLNEQKCGASISNGSKYYLGMRPSQEMPNNKAFNNNDILAIWDKDVKVIIEEKKVIGVYDYVKDPEEAINLGEKGVKDGAEVMKIYDEVLPRRVAGRESAAKPISAKERKELKALGYIK